jgi:hypothetical protein
VRDKHEDDNDERIGADVGEAPGDFDELALYIRKFLRIRVDSGERVL